jgi:hypothetical protein
MGEDEHLEMDYEDRNGSALPEHLLGEESEDIYAGTAALDDVDGDYEDGDAGPAPTDDYDREEDYWKYSGDGR